MSGLNKNKNKKERSDISHDTYQNVVNKEWH